MKAFLTTIYTKIYGAFRWLLHVLLIAAVASLKGIIALSQHLLDELSKV